MFIKGVERHACGILKQLGTDYKFIFYTGGIIYDSSDVYRGGYSSYDSYYYFLTGGGGGWHSMTGTTSAQNVDFVNTSPYTGFAFNDIPASTDSFWIWDEYAFKFVHTPGVRTSLRYKVAVASIPKSSPFVQNCS